MAMKEVVHEELHGLRDHVTRRPRRRPRALRVRLGNKPTSDFHMSRGKAIAVVGSEEDEQDKKEKGEESKLGDEDTRQDGNEGTEDIVGHQDAQRDTGMLSEEGQTPNAARQSERLRLLRGGGDYVPGEVSVRATKRKALQAVTELKNLIQQNYFRYMAKKTRLGPLQGGGIKKKQRITRKTKINLQAELRTESRSLWNFVPPDIVANILSRLPEKSVAKLRCVCKQWYSLTHGAYFLNSLHKGSSCIKIRHNVVVKKEILFYDLDGNKSSYEMDFGSWWYHLSNAVNGLTCAYGDTARSNVYIFNPMTRQKLELPKNENRVKFLQFSEQFGFGIDDSTGEYKIVRLFFRQHFCCCEILTVGSGQWRYIGQASYKILNHVERLIFVQGTLHGITRRHQNDEVYNDVDGKIILTFDIKNEKFGLPISIPLPPYNKVYHMDLIESGGHLCLVFNGFYDRFAEIWMLRDYVNSKWIKQYSFELPSPFNVIGIVNDKILLELHENIYEESERCSANFYDPHSKVLHRLFDKALSRDFTIHRSSLISPKETVGKSQKCSKKSVGESCS